MARSTQKLHTALLGELIKLSRVNLICAQLLPFISLLKITTSEPRKILQVAQQPLGTFSTRIIYDVYIRIITVYRSDRLENKTKHQNNLRKILKRDSPGGSREFTIYP